MTTLTLELWLNRSGNTLDLVCSDPPGKNGMPCDKNGIAPPHYIVQLTIEAEGEITQQTVRRVRLRQPRAMAAAKKAKAAAPAKAAKKAVKATKKAQTVQSDSPGKKAK